MISRPSVAPSRRPRGRPARQTGVCWRPRMAICRCTCSTPPRCSYGMRPLRYSINVTLDGCCDHRVMIADEDVHRHAIENIERADALLLGRVTYEMMESAWREPTPTGERPDWMEAFARKIDAAKKYVMSRTLE